MKKIALYFTIILMFVFAACGTNSEQEIANQNNTSPDSLEVYIKTDKIMDTAFQTPANAATVHFKKSATEQGIDFSGSCKIKVETLSEKKLQFFDVNYIGEYTRSEITSDKVAMSNFNRRFDRYVFTDNNTNDEIDVQYLNGTDTIGFLYRFSDDYERWDVNAEYLSENELKSISQEFLLTMIPKDELDKYTLIDISYPQEGVAINYFVTYRRDILGYSTDDVLSVIVNQNKTIVGYNGKNYGKYSSVEKSLTKEGLDKAKTVLYNKIDELKIDYAEIYNCRLASDIYGGIYIAIDLSYGEKMNQQDSLYVKVFNAAQ